MLTEEHAALLKERILLKKQLDVVETQLAGFNDKLKTEMLANGVKSLELNGVKVTYTPPREYLAFQNEKFALEFLKETRPDMVVYKRGFEKLTTSLL